MATSIKRTIPVQLVYYPFIQSNGGSTELYYDVTFHRGTPTIPEYQKAVSSKTSILVCLFKPEESSDKLREIVYVMGLEPWLLPEENVKAYTIDDEEGFDLTSSVDLIMNRVKDYLVELTNLRVEEHKTRHLVVNEGKLNLMSSIRSSLTNKG